MAQPDERWRLFYTHKWITHGRAHLPLSLLPLDMLPLQGSRRGLITDSCPENCNRSHSKGNFLRHWLKYTHSRGTVPSFSSEPAARRRVILLGKLSATEGRLQMSDSPHLERLKPARPEWDASSISGVTMRSIMSVSTVKVGTTMKSMNPGDTQVGWTSSPLAMSDYLTVAALGSDNSDLYLVPLLWNMVSRLWSHRICPRRWHKNQANALFGTYRSSLQPVRELRGPDSVLKNSVTSMT